MDHAPRLEPYLLMGKGAKGAAAAKLIKDATSAPGVYVFAELLDFPNVQELANNPQHAQSHAMLQLFSFGTYQQYKQNPGAYPALTPAQLVKLKHLSIASLAMESKILPYPVLLSALDVSSIRELEDLIIDAIYQDVVRGKLDQKEHQFEVEFTMGRDIPPGQLGTLLSALQEWSARTAAVLSELDNQIQSIQSQEVAAKLHLEDQDRRRDLVIQDIHAAAKASREQPLLTGALGGSKRLNVGKDYDGMDLDEPVTSGGGGGLGGLLGGWAGSRKKPSQTSQTTSSLGKKRGRT
jgi:COP9 signalosome complex subunit 7